jgi:hypothetical protein
MRALQKAACIPPPGARQGRIQHECADTKKLDSSATDFALRGILARRISQERLNELLNCPHHCRAGAHPFDPAQITKF